jgi:cytochrome P450
VNAPGTRPPEAPHALPLLGHAGRLWYRPLPFIRELGDVQGLVTLRLGPYRAYLACGAATVLEILHDPRTFDKGGPLFEKARLLVGDGLVSSDFGTHRRQRLLLQPAFHSARLTGYQQLMAEQVDATLDGWRPGQVLSLGHAMHTLTLQVAARTMFGARLDDRAIGEVVTAMPVIMRGVYQRMILPVDWTHRLPLPVNRRFERARATMHRIIRDTVRAYRQAGQDHGDVLSILVHTRDEHGAGLAGDEIHDQVMTLLIGATEPPGDALTWILALLAAHPEAERAVQAEADRVLGGRPAAALTPDDMTHLEHTHRVVQEALRLYPPAWLLTRTTTRDTELAGHLVRKGSTVLFSPYQTQHDPRAFPEPQRFDPDRWREPSAAARLAMLPFGAGNRKCIGDEVALTELVVATAAVAARFRLRPIAGTLPRPLARASLGADRVLMAVQSRRPYAVRSLADRAGAAAS